VTGEFVISFSLSVHATVLFKDNTRLKLYLQCVCHYSTLTVIRYVAYPELMVTLVSYIRRESLRLEGLDDNAIMGARRVGHEGEGVQNLAWGDLKNAGR